MRATVTSFGRASVLLLVSLLSFLSCSDSFHPSAPFEPQIVLYSVLSTQSDTQYVRLYSTYDPPDHDPSLQPREEPVTDARVTLSDGNSTWVFRDTVIQRADSGRYTNDIRLYYCHPLVVKPNKEYVVNVSSPTHGQATAQTRVPEVGAVSIVTPSVVALPSVYFPRAVEISYRISPLAKAYLVQFFLVYTSDNYWDPPEARHREKFFEVPLQRKYIDIARAKCSFRYPDVVRGTRQTPSPRDPSVEPLVIMAYAFPAYNVSLVHIYMYNNNVKIRRAVAYLSQFDDPWQKYHASTSVYQDRLSVRLEQPNYTNVRGGYGLFASMQVDSAVWPLPEFVQAYPTEWKGTIPICSEFR